jgi:hypothetical protein
MARIKTGAPPVVEHRVAAQRPAVLLPARYYPGNRLDSVSSKSRTPRGAMSK